MKFSERWLREWVDAPVSTDKLVSQLTGLGLEVDGVDLEPRRGELGDQRVGGDVRVDPLA